MATDAWWEVLAPQVRDPQRQGQVSAVIPATRPPVWEDAGQDNLLRPSGSRGQGPTQDTETKSFHSSLSAHPALGASGEAGDTRRCLSSRAPRSEPLTHA